MEVIKPEVWADLQLVYVSSSVNLLTRALGGLCICQFNERNGFCTVVTGQHAVASVVHIAVCQVFPPSHISQHSGGIQCPK
jgi:hypothetical protein